MITVENVSFSYINSPFIEDINFSVKKGEIFGFLGPSGAGKSTLQKILTGLILNYSGSVVVNGTEVKHRTNNFYQDIGVDFEFPSLYDKFTGRQNLKFFGSLYSNQLRDVDELLNSVGLLNDAEKKISEYSKGMKSRLNFVKALIHNPQIIFLDEPTSGLDPANGRTMKDLILEEKKNGKTIIVTTHNMTDATELCDHVAFIVDGKIKALDTPRNLIMNKGASKLTYSYMENNKEIFAECDLSQTHKDKKLCQLINSGKLLTIHSLEPTLSDIFMDVTGRELK